MHRPEGWPLMYATSHRVRAPSGAEAVHSFLHAHGELAWPDDVSGWPETQPGQLVAQRGALPIGGNRVTAYLDVLAPDNTPARTLEAALKRFAEDLDERRNPTVFRAGKVTVRLGVELRLESGRKRLLAELSSALLALAGEELPLRTATVSDAG